MWARFLFTRSMMSTTRGYLSKGGPVKFVNNTKNSSWGNKGKKIYKDNFSQLSQEEIDRLLTEKEKLVANSVENHGEFDVLDQGMSKR
ncbi:MAG: hypothetical protein KIT56_00980 [Gammaproteobacteria bacterium]|nr:hypothetical protein [Gammaproteobacteria bacterium]MCW5582458.1 hypothetical protein [Gammaproteobacteria bacterium]